MIEWLAGLEPGTLLALCALLGALLALPFEAAALARLRRGRVLGGTLLFALGGALLLAGALAGVIAASLHGYARLTHEQDAAEAAVARIGERHFALTLTRAGEVPQVLDLRGDAWQIDARVLKWRGLGTLLGFDTIYRLERLGGRYTDIGMERTAPRTVHSLADDEPLDLWTFAKRYHAYLPFADALYGSAAYVPLADGARYRVSVSASGLVIRPANEAAQQAVGTWR